MSTEISRITSIPQTVLDIGWVLPEVDEASAVRISAIPATLRLFIDEREVHAGETIFLADIGNLRLSKSADTTGALGELAYDLLDEGGTALLHVNESVYAPVTPTNIQLTNSVPWTFNGIELTLYELHYTLYGVDRHVYVGVPDQLSANPQLVIALNGSSEFENAWGMIDTVYKNPYQFQWPLELATRYLVPFVAIDAPLSNMGQGAIGASEYYPTTAKMLVDNDVAGTLVAKAFLQDMLGVALADEMFAAGLSLGGMRTGYLASILPDVTHSYVAGSHFSKDDQPWGIMRPATLLDEDPSYDWIDLYKASQGTVRFEFGGTNDYNYYLNTPEVDATINALLAYSDRFSFRMGPQLGHAIDLPDLIQFFGTFLNAAPSAHVDTPLPDLDITAFPIPTGPLYQGTARNELFAGTAADDVLVGGGGQDVLYGREGRDTFVFKAWAESRAERPDLLYDFTSDDLLGLPYSPAYDVRIVPYFTGRPGEARLTRIDTNYSYFEVDPRGNKVPLLKLVLRGDFADGVHFGAYYENGLVLAPAQVDAVSFIDATRGSPAVAMLTHGGIGAGAQSGRAALVNVTGDSVPELVLQTASGKVFLTSFGTNASGVLELGTIDPQSTLFVGDFNGDTKLDLLWTKPGQQSVLWRLDDFGRVTVQGGTYDTSGRSPTALATASRYWLSDLDADGRPDVLLQQPSGQVMIGRFSTGSALAPAGSIGADSTPYFADFDGDGDTDIIWANTRGDATLWSMQNASVAGVSGVVPSTPNQIAGVADFNLDGKADIVWVNEWRQIWLWYMDGATRTGGGFIGDLPTGFTVSGVADYTQDGRPDLLLRRADGSAELWILNDFQTVNRQTYRDVTVPLVERDVSTLVTGHGLYGHIAASDIESRDLVFRITQGPAHGHVTLDRVSGQFLYNPQPGYVGSDAFIVAVSNGNGAEVLANVALEVTGYTGVDVDALARVSLNGAIRAVADVNGDGAAELITQTQGGAVFMAELENYQPTFMALGTVAANSTPLFADFSGDGQSDILWRNPANGAVLWVMSGNTVANSYTIVPSSPNSADAVGDMNRDGYADIVWLNSARQVNAWYMNRNVNIGGGLIGVLDSSMSGVADLADYTGDGSLDLLVNKTNGTQELWVLNGFSVVARRPYVALEAGTLPIAEMSPVTVKHDEWLAGRISSNTLVGDEAHFAVANAPANGRLDFNRATGEFLYQPATDRVADDSFTILVTDGLGAPVTRTVNVTVEAALPLAARLIDGASIAAALDVNGDGVPELLLRDSAGDVLLAAFARDGVALTPLGAAGPGSEAALADADGDGDLDIMWAQASGNTVVWKLQGSSVTGVHDLPGEVRWTGDLDHTGAPEIVSQTQSGDVFVSRLGSAGVTSTFMRNIAPDSTPYFGDFDADGKTDILWAKPSGNAQLWQMNGAQIVNRYDLVTSTSAHVVGVADFNRDGRADIAWLNPYGEIWVWHMNRQHMSSTGRVGVLPPGFSGISSVADYTGDQFPDLVLDKLDGSHELWVLNDVQLVRREAYVEPDSDPVLPDYWYARLASSSGTASYALMQTASGEVFIQNPTTTSRLLGTAGAESVPYFGDFNRNGQTDVLWSNADGTGTLWMLQGLVVASTAALAATASGRAVGVADVNGDGNVDIVRLDAARELSVSYMNGAVETGEATIGMLPPGVESVVNVADYTHDNHPDVLLRKADGSTVLWVLNGATVTGLQPYVEASALSERTAATVASNDWFFGNLSAGGRPAVSFLASSPPLHGELTLDPLNGDFFYRPRDDYAGSDAFSILVTLNDGTKLNHTVSMTVTGDGPPGANATFHVVRPATAGALIGVADFDHDGVPEILTRTSTDDVLIGKVTGNAIAQTRLGSMAGGATATFGDFDGNNHTDIAWSKSDGTAVMWRLRAGPGILEASDISPSTPNTIAGSADFNADGFADLVWVNQTRQIWTWYMQGPQKIGGGRVGDLPVDALRIEDVLDYTRDGHPDLLVSKADGSKELWALDGSTLLSRTAYVMPAPTVTEATDVVLARGDVLVGDSSGLGSAYSAYGLLASPAHGAVTINHATGAFAYQADATYTGSDSFSLYGTDGAISAQLDITLHINSSLI